MIALGSKLFSIVCIFTIISFILARGTQGQDIQHRMLLQQANDNRIAGVEQEEVMMGGCLGAGEFSRALLEVCIVSDLAEFVSLPSTYRTACCNLVEQYFSRECAGTCVAEEAMQQTNIWLSVCRVNLPPLQICTEEELQLQAPLMEQISLPAIQAVQQAKENLDVQQEASPSAAQAPAPAPSPQLQKDPVVVSSTQQTQDSLNSLALNTEIFQTGDTAAVLASPPSPAPLIELFSSGDAQMRAAERPTAQSTYVLPPSDAVVVSQSSSVMPLSIPILPSVNVAGFQQLKLLEAIQSIDAIKLFASAMIGNQALVEELQKPGFFTVFAPTDTAVVEFISTRSSDDGFNLWRDAVVHHFVADKITISSINGEKPLVMFDNKETVVERISTSVAIGGDIVLLKGCCSEGNFARVVVADVPVKNGMLHIVDRVLVPSQAFP